jgi:hypothetical protein
MKNLSIVDLDELVQASALVPTWCVRKQYVDVEKASTAAPSSAQQSPELFCMENDEAWPSLPDATEPGWDFCHAGTNTEEVWELPPPAVPLEDNHSEMNSNPAACAANSGWCLVPGSGSTPVIPKAVDARKISELDGRVELTPKATFASLLRAQPSRTAASTVKPANDAPRVRRRAGINATPSERCPSQAANGAGLTSQEESADLDQADQWHGWKNQHKASRNTRHECKMANQKARKLRQSCLSRGWMKDGAADEA